MKAWSFHSRRDPLSRRPGQGPNRRADERRPGSARVGPVSGLAPTEAGVGRGPSACS